MIEQAKQWGLWAIELRETGELIGRCGFYAHAKGESSRAGAGVPAPGRLLGQGARDRGGPRSARAPARRTAPLRVVSIVRPENAASRRVLEKVGLREAGSLEFRGMPVLFYATPL